MQQITISTSGGETILTFSGSLDTNTTSNMEETAKEAISSAQTVVLDFKDVDYMDSTGLGFLVGMKTQAERGKIPMILQNLPDHMNQLLTLTRLKDTFRIR